jgi:hypothetical protein
LPPPSKAAEGVALDVAATSEPLLVRLLARFHLAATVRALRATHGSVTGASGVHHVNAKEVQEREHASDGRVRHDAGVHHHLAGSESSGNRVLRGRRPTREAGDEAAGRVAHGCSRSLRYRLTLLQHGRDSTTARNAGDNAVHRDTHAAGHDGDVVTEARQATENLRAHPTEAGEAATRTTAGAAARRTAATGARRRLGRALSLNGRKVALKSDGHGQSSLLNPVLIVL